MKSFGGTVVFLLITTTVLCTPLINKLQPGQQWPKCNSVQQPNHYEPLNQTSKEEFSTDDPLESEIKDDDTVAIIPRILEPREDTGKVDYSGAQIWKVSTKKPGTRATIGRLRRRNLISTWGGNQTSIDILVKPNTLENVTRVFKRDNIGYEVIIEDLQIRINEENPPLDDNEIAWQDRGARYYNVWRYKASQRRIGIMNAYMGYNSINIPMEYWPNAYWGHPMTWKKYHRLEDIHSFMDYLARTYPAIVSVNTIGKSFEGRDIKVLRISNGKPSNKAVWIDGGIHAREWISPATVTYFINQFAESFDNESDDIKNIDWHFLPVVNPDGYEYTHMKDRLWRKNRKPGFPAGACTGTDLNRNFGYHWGGKGASSYPCSEIYRGNRAFSEPETQAISNFIKSSAANFYAYVTYHSYGQYLLYPWGYDNALPPDYTDLDDLGKRMAQAIQQTGGSQYQVGSSSGLLYPAAGGSDDWAKSQGIKYTFTIELSDTGRYGFILPTTYIERVAKENLAALRVLANQVNKE